MLWDRFSRFQFGACSAGQAAVGWVIVSKGDAIQPPDSLHWARSFNRNIIRSPPNDEDEMAP